MNGARFIDSLKPINWEKLAAVQRRETLKVEARLRQKLAKSNRGNRLPARSAEAETLKMVEAAEMAGNSRTAPETEASKSETRAVARTRQREHEQRRNLVLLMNQLKRERLLEDMSEEDVKLLEAAAWKRIKGEMNDMDWLPVLKNLKDRRELRHPPPKYERRHNPPVGW